MAIVRIITDADLPALVARFPDSGAAPGLDVTADNPFNASARRLYQRLGYRDSGLGAFVSGYTYWDPAGVPHRDEELYRYLMKELVG
jgi:hypothetical protein